jgi:aspartyl-tRNA(Asn)/glutamyl-tRNA(Gln) amidotransferase subunit A
MYLSDVCTIPINIAGLPAISIPCGLAPAGGGSASGGDGLPVGVQIMAKPFDETAILRVAYAYEQATDWHKARPRL